MIDLATQDQAAAYLLGEMSQEERVVFEARIRRDPALQAHLRDASEALVALTLELPQDEPAPAVREKVLGRVAAEVAQEAAKVLPLTPPPVLHGSGGRWGWFAAAAAVVLAAVVIWQGERTRALQEQQAGLLRERLSAAEARIAQLTTEAAKAAATAAGGQQRLRELEKSNAELAANLAAARNENVLGRIVAGTLRATVAGGGDTPTPARGAFVWDPEKQEGVLTVENLPLIPPSFDYEMWVADAGQPVPVGTFRPSRIGRQTFRFKADVKIAQATEFMVTREQRGGSKKIEGPAVLVSDKY